MENEGRLLKEELSLNLEEIRNDFGNSQDIKIREVVISGRKAAFLLCDGMVNSIQLGELVMTPIMRTTIKAKLPFEHYCLIRDSVTNAVEQSEVNTVEDAELYMMSGFVVFLLDGVASAIVIGVQGWAKRGIEEPGNEAMAKGAKEGFIESLNDNVALVRKRLKTSNLKFEMLKLGMDAKTNVTVAYIEGKADEKIVKEVKKRLNDIPADAIVDYGCIQPYLDTDHLSFFTAVGNTERPDTFSAKLMEGRIGVMIDGTPYALIVPYLFTENFQTLDDYDNRPYFATFIRILKYLAFVLSMLVPGFYVAVGTFHQELFPSTFLFDVAAAEYRTPFNLMTEALLIHFLYEIMREAGLRLPKTIGHAVSIIGAIVIGDATVSAGLIGAPMLIVVAVTAISSYVVYPLYEPVALLRFFFIVIGGVTGLYGIMIFAAMLMVNVASISPYGVPFTSPLTPFDPRSIKDTAWRAGWKRLFRHPFKIQDLRGADIDQIL